MLIPSASGEGWEPGTCLEAQLFGPWFPCLRRELSGQTYDEVLVGLDHL